MQQLRRLSRRRAARQEHGVFVIEGPTLVAEAIAAGVQIRELFTASDPESDLVAAARASGARVHTVAASVLAGAIDTVTPQGVAAIADRVEVSVDDAISAACVGPLALVLVGVSDPGNAGTLLRAAEAAGAAAVLFCGDSVDPGNPKCVRASAGALFHLPVAIEGEAEAVIDRLRAAGVRTAATVVRGGVPYDSVDLADRVALVLGNEAHGLPGSIEGHVDLQLSIPMAGRSESLNVAMAGAVLCFESLRQRRSAAG